MNWEFLLKNQTTFDRIVNRLSFEQHNKEDFSQDCALAVASKAETFDESKGGVATFIYWCCRSVQKEFYRRKQRKSKEKDISSYITPHVIIKEEEQFVAVPIQKCEDFIDVFFIKKTLTKEELAVCALLERGYKQNTIANLLGTNQMFISRTKNTR